MGKIIGIDLGTTNSVVAAMVGGEPTVISSSEGGRTVPSVVGFVKGGERVVGQLAKRQAVTNPKNTVFSIKRFMGRRFDDAEVTKTKGLVPYAVEKDGKSDGVKVKLESGESYSPPEVSAMILQKLKADAEAFLGEKITEAVITVPAYFDDTQRQATKDAGRIAGLDVKRIINEPTAAALAYGLDKKKEEKIAVYDLGGGTFDISILELGDGVFEVKSSNGDTHLGGDDFDQRIIDWLLAEFKKDQGIDLSKDQQALQRLKEAAEKAKIELSGTGQTEINLPYITADATGPKHVVVTLTKAKLESLVAGAGLQPRTFMAFPDYKLTRTVMAADASTPSSLLTNLPRFPSPDWTTLRPRVVDEGRLWSTLVTAGVHAEFPNSFLVDAHKTDSESAMNPWPEGSWCSVGDFVRVPKYGGDKWTVKINDDEEIIFVILNDLDLIGKVTGDPLTMKAFV